MPAIALLILTALPLVSALPASARPPQLSGSGGESRSLQHALTRFLDHRTGRSTVGVTDLVTGQRILVRPHHPQLTASIVKVEILEALLARHHAPLREPRIRAARRMIEQSSNTDAQTLWEAIGRASGLRAFGRRAGLEATRPAAGSGPGYAWGLTLTTPADQLRILALLVTPNPILTYRDRAFVLRLMCHVEPDQAWGITAGTSGETSTAVKDGWLPLRNGTRDWQTNSIGYVHAPHHDYLIVVLDTGSPTMDYGISTVQQISRIVWRHTGHRAQVGS